MSPSSFNRVASSHLVKSIDSHLSFLVKKYSFEQGRTQGGIWGWTPFEFDLLQNLYCLRNGDYLRFIIFSLVCCQLNTCTT